MFLQFLISQGTLAQLYVIDYSGPNVTQGEVADLQCASLDVDCPPGQTRALAISTVVEQYQNNINARPPTPVEVESIFGSFMYILHEISENRILSHLF